MADAVFNVPFTFVGATQQAANDKRDAALLDYCLAEGLSIWTDETRTVVDPTKVPIAFRSHIKGQAKARVVDFRGNQAATSARDSTRTAEDESLGEL